MNGKINFSLDFSWVFPGGEGDPCTDLLINQIRIKRFASGG